MPDTPNCLDPECGKPLVGGRADRRYCDAKCYNRHFKKARKSDDVTARRALAVREMTDVERGYVAGVLEGEGSFGVLRHNNKGHLYLYPLVAMQMTDEDVVMRCRDLTGVGRVYGPLTPPSREGKKPTWAWRVQGEAAISLMSTMKPLLGMRRQNRIEEVLAETEKK